MPIWQVDAKLQAVNMYYDALNRLVGKTYSTGVSLPYSRPTDPGAGYYDVEYEYDSQTSGDNGNGRRTIMTDASGTTTYTYDTRGRVSSETRTIDSVNYTTAFTYDGLDRSLTVVYPTGETVTNNYNGRGLPYTVSGSVAGNLVTSTLYNQLGAITEINLGNGVKTTYGYYGTGGTYDTTGGYYGRLWEIKSVSTSPDPDETRQDVVYTWDANGNMLSRVDGVSSTTENFTYDSLDRLTAVSGAYSESYSYDTIGNLTSNNGVTQTYGNNAGPHAITYDGTNSYTYDANGNMNVGTARSWDVENRLTSVTKNSVTETYVYDGDGNRIKKVVQGGDTTVYVNQYYEKNITTGDVTTYYYLGGKLVAKMVDDGEDTTLTFIHQDSLNSTSLVTTDAGTQESIATYYPFGGTRTGSVSTDQKFTGQRLDDTGLYYYNARYYDASIGRFISPDTIVQNPANPQTLNRYSYCLNNPLKYTDPSGHASVADFEGGWAADPSDPPPAPNPPTPAPKPDEPEMPIEDEIEDDESNNTGFSNNDVNGSNDVDTAIKPPEPNPPVFDNSPFVIASIISLGILSDDATVVGIVDDPLIIVAYVVAAAVWVGINWDNIFLAEHTKKRPSTWDKHSKKRSGAPEKKDTKPNWWDRSGKRR